LAFIEFYQNDKKVKKFIIKLSIISETMKIINIAKYLNRVIFALTLMLYVTVILGLYAQVVLGAYQLLVGFILLFFLKKLSLKPKNGILIYWFVVSIYFVITYTLNKVAKDFPVINFMIIPMLIASYFTYILETMKLKK
jgi:predicted neutral ceramidase superfamily lipid hydrolase